ILTALTLPRLARRTHRRRRAGFLHPRNYNSRAGAFALIEGSRDAALILSTATNVNYTIQVSGVNGDTGVALVEVYDVTDL
ncbi:MAG: hypothetical protein RLZZ15_3068, partial [Verrucomicrobiota bacterium]